MKSIPLLLLSACSILAASPKEVLLTDSAHTFEGAFSCSETYRINGMVAVANCLNYKWSIHISTEEKNYKRVTYSDYYGPGGGGIDKLYSKDFDEDGDLDLMAVLVNGGRFQDGKQKSEVIFFMLGEDKIEMKSIWTEGFNLKIWEHLYQNSQPKPNQS
ncbi:MAG: hypothetical protein ACSHX8_13935 [Opitutaceae bacterium]